MSTVVQATCPGCKQVLRIPADWLNQPFRCKNCRTIIQAKALPSTLRPSGPATPTPLPPSKPSKAAPPAPAKTPTRPTPPVAVAVPAAPQVRPAPQSAPVAIPVPARAASSPPVAIPVNAAGVPLAPMAIPVAATAPNVFDGIDGAMDGSGPGPRRRRGFWVPLLVGIILIGGTAAAAVHFWPHLAPMFEKDKKEKGPLVAQDDRKPTPPVEDDKDKPKNKDRSGVTPPKPSDKTKPDDKKPADKKPADKKPADKKPEDPTKKPITPDKPSDKPKPDDKKPADKKPTDKKPEDPTKKPIPASVAFPRRALVISVHNYLFANPLTVGDSQPSGRNIQNLVGRLSQTRGFRISPNQVAFLSDAARFPHKVYSPIKGTIEGTITEYLQTARAQDRVVLLFAGHAAEMDGQVYLDPIEGDLTIPANMIPLKWLYKQLEECKAQQKLLILDVCRQNMARGEERASFGEMTPKFDLALKNPPPGIQVWASCTEGQKSYEFEDARINNSVFLDALYQVADKGIEGIIQRPDDPIPVDQFVEMVNGIMKKNLEPLKLVQTSRLSGTMGPQLAYDPNDKLAVDPLIVAAAQKSAADATIVRAILKEVSVPPIKKQQAEGLLRYEAMPPFNADTLDKYPTDNTPNPLRDAIERAQATLWAISPNPPPGELAAAVQKIKDSGELKGDLSTLKESYIAPGAGNAENAFKDQVFNDGRQAAKIIRLLEEELDKMKTAAVMRKEAPKRWQANYDFVLARLQAQLAYMYEYSSMLGSMRKELPPRDPALHRGWRLASSKKLQGDGTGRKLIKEAEKLLEKLVADHPGTPWELLARREKLTALGLQWKPN